MDASAFDLEEYFEDLVSKECGWDKDNTALSVKKVRAYEVDLSEDNIIKVAIHRDTVDKSSAFLFRS